ncbi:hypothetical protein Scel_10130 [Streptomyces cellostaticus]|nr:hypothetical protein Scel_10130 [Streptomyces cellostaticus]
MWSQDQARVATGLPKLIGRWQAFLFFLLLLLEGVNLHVSSARALGNHALKNRALDGALLYGPIATYMTAVFLVLPPGMAIAFLAVHQCLFGLCLGCLFAPNHKGMPILTGKDRPDFLLRSPWLSSPWLTTRRSWGSPSDRRGVARRSHPTKSPTVPAASRTRQRSCQQRRRTARRPRRRQQR